MHAFKPSLRRRVGALGLLAVAALCALPAQAQDYPANTKRLIQRSEGVHYTIVNGTVIQEDSKLTGDLPGQVLRGAAYRAKVRTAV